MLTAQLTHPHNKTEFATDFYVTDKAEPVLGVDACRRLDIEHIDGESVCVVSETGPRITLNTADASSAHASITAKSRATAGTALV